MTQDKTLTCRECSVDFIFSASEQDFYAEKGLTNEPGRCPECRAARKRNGGGGQGRSTGGYQQQREMHDATCAACGVETQVPFRPSGDRPVYCRDCFSQNSPRR